MTALLVLVASVLALLVTAHGWRKVAVHVGAFAAGGLPTAVLFATVVGVGS